MKSLKILLSFSLLCMSLFSHAENKGKYENFKVSIYTRAYEVQSMTDPAWLDSTWNIISSQMKVDKIYLETHRDLNIVKADDMKRIIKFFKDRGVEVATRTPRSVPRQRKSSNSPQVCSTRSYLMTFSLPIANATTA